MKRKILNIIKQPLIYVLIFCILIQIKMYSTIPSYVEKSDSKTYVEDYTENILKGEVNALRTPVYPYFIKLVKLIGGTENLYRNIAIAQKILFVITLLLFYKCIEKITKNYVVTVIITIIFGICPFVIFWNAIILTESISIFEMVVLSYFTILYLQEAKKNRAIFIAIQILIMIFTRPSFLYLLPIYALFWLLRLLLNKKEKEAIYGLVGCLICGAVLLGYCGLMKAEHGEFSLTAVSYINKAALAIESEAYKYSKNEDMLRLIENVKESKEGTECWEEVAALEQTYTVEQIKEFANETIKEDPNYIIYLIEKTLGLSYSDIGTVYATNENINYTYLGNLIMPINFAMLYIVLAIAICYLIFNLVKRARIEWYIAFFTVSIIGNLFTLIAYAPYEAQRLFAPSIPLTLLFIGYVISKGICNVKHTENDYINKEK